LSKPTLIKKGDKITIIAKNNGFQISMKGTALTAGGKDDKIRVKNSKTKKIIQGIIFDAQTVKVTL
jgi:flagella basal body P-ring formation protein FlgA